MTEQAERYKSQGNTALQAKMYGDAVELYTKAIGLNPNCEIYFSNRSAAYAAMERFREALDDAQEVVGLKPNWVKGHVRRAVALTGLKKHEEARKAYLRASQLEPANAQLVESMKASAEAAKRESEKNWEGDLWSDDEGDTTAAAAAAATATGAGDSAKHARDEEGMAEACAPPRKKRKPDSKLQLQLRQSLADSSEDTLRACLTQITMADADLAQKALHILEGLNAASSEGSDADADGDGDEGSWLDPKRGGGRRGGGSDSD
uniref:Uncharacterized protein n=1 Tax=Haptolina ericina TaxID=156174 RepID=A0A7S3B649_9EUKA|mmetsp:Transcript_49557/g.111440  ORF Transcript_49557/g.111440 Transcript_49557/m.111440 type:complete len:263 (+) Transcript_49557:29-817(+)